MCSHFYKGKRFSLGWAWVLSIKSVAVTSLGSMPVILQLVVMVDCHHITMAFVLIILLENNEFTSDKGLPWLIGGKLRCWSHIRHMFFVDWGLATLTVWQRIYNHAAFWHYDDNWS